MYAILWKKMIEHNLPFAEEIGLNTPPLPPSPPSPPTTLSHLYATLPLMAHQCGIGGPIHSMCLR